MLKDELQDENVDKLVAMQDEIIGNLCNGESSLAADGFVDLAKYYAQAGMPLSAFEGMRKVIIGSAINKTGEPGFIKAKLEEAEHLLRFKRTPLHIIH